MKAAGAGPSNLSAFPAEQSGVLSDSTGYNLRCYNETARLLFPGVGRNDSDSTYYPQKTVAAADSYTGFSKTSCRSAAPIITTWPSAMPGCQW